MNIFFHTSIPNNCSQYSVNTRISTTTAAEMKLTIQLDPPANAGKAYTSLEVVRGSVSLYLGRAQPISKIVVSLKGQ
jgi:hypothetical protein